MTILTKIGNSQGIRISKPLIQQTHLENGLLIKPVSNTSRNTQEENIQKVISKSRDTKGAAVLEDWQWQWISKGFEFIFRPKIKFEKKDGLILLDQIRTVDKTRLVKKLGDVDKKTALNISKILVQMFEQ